MDGHKVVAFSAAVVTLWGIYRLLESSTRVVRRGIESTKTPAARSTAPPPTPPQRNGGTLPTPPTPAAPAAPTPAAILSPASVPTLKTPHPEQGPTAHTSQSNQPNISSTQQPVSQKSVHEPEEARMPETPYPQTQARETKPKEVSQPPKVEVKEPIEPRHKDLPKQEEPKKEEPKKEEPKQKEEPKPKETKDHESRDVKESKEAKQKDAKESKEAKQKDSKPKPTGKKQPPTLQVSSDSRVERIDSETLASWLTKGEKPILVDVRTDHYKGGNVTGSKHLSYAQYKTGNDFLEELKPQKAQKIVFYCMYGKEQSPAAAGDFLSASDPALHLQVYVLHGGFQGWLRYCARADLSAYINEYNQDFWVPQDGGLAYRADLEEPEPTLERAPSLRHLRMQSSTLRLNLDENHRFEFVEAQTLGLWLASSNKPVLVDVRSEDYKGGHIVNAMHIPFASFSTRIGEVQAAIRENTGERKNVVVFYCLFGEERSPTCAMKFLTKQTDPSVKVYVLRRGFQEWLNFCMQSTPIHDRVQEYDPEKWVKQDKLGYVYKTNYSA